METPSVALTQRRSSQAPPRQASRGRARTRTPTQTISRPRPRLRPVDRMTNRATPTHMLSPRYTPAVRGRSRGGGPNTGPPPPPPGVPAVAACSTAIARSLVSPRSCQVEARVREAAGPSGRLADRGGDNPRSGPGGPPGWSPGGSGQQALEVVGVECRGANG